MNREAVATCPLGRDQLALHRHTPERSLPELLVASARVNDPVRRALFHLQGCAPCSAGDPCARGASLIEPCRGWRLRPGTGPQ